MKKAIAKFGFASLVRLLVSPVTVILTTPFRFFQLIWDCRVLAFGKWGQYSSFASLVGINQLWYWTIGLNLDTYGRDGRSPSVGMGDYPLAKWFNISLFSIYLNWRMSNISVLIASLALAFSNLLWLDGVRMLYVFLVILFLLLSSTFYHLLVNQNYNIIGWMALPTGLWGMCEGNWLLVGIAWFWAGNGSLTTVFVAFLWMLAVACSTLSVMPILAIIPSLLLILTRLIPLLSSGILRETFVETAKAIGAQRSKAKYVRSASSNSFWNLAMRLFPLVFYVLLGSVVQYESGGVGLVLLCYWVSLFLFFLNASGLFRFADPWSFSAIIASVSTALVLSNFSWFAFAAFLLAINPIPFILAWQGGEALDIVPRRKPFPVYLILEKVRHFLEDIKPSDKILMSFEDPDGDYNKIFDGYRRICEAAFYVSTEKKANIFPDFYAVFDNNHEGAIEFWGRDAVAVNTRSKQFKASWVIMYDTESSRLNLDEYNLKLHATLSWEQFDSLFKGHSPYPESKHPTWYLMRV